MEFAKVVPTNTLIVKTVKTWYTLILCDLLTTWINQSAIVALNGIMLNVQLAKPFFPKKTLFFKVITTNGMIIMKIIFVLPVRQAGLKNVATLLKLQLKISKLKSGQNCPLSIYPRRIIAELPILQKIG